MQTPWGPSQECKSCGDGLVFVSTASHGGFYVFPEMLAQMPEYFRRNDGWYEEDCEWAMVVISFPSRFSEKETVDASGTLQNWFPDLYERHFAVRLLPGESYKRDQAVFDEENKDKLVPTWLAASPPKAAAATPSATTPPTVTSSCRQPNTKLERTSASLWTRQGIPSVPRSPE